MCSNSISTQHQYFQLSFITFRLFSYFYSGRSGVGGVRLTYRRLLIKRPGLNQPPSPNKRPILREKFIRSTKVQISSQIHLSAQLKLGTNLKKIKRKIFGISFGRNFGRNFVIFVKNLLAWHFLWLLLFHFFNKRLAGLIKDPVWTSVFSKAFAFNKCPECLIGYLRYVRKMTAVKV